MGLCTLIACPKHLLNLLDWVLPLQGAPAMCSEGACGYSAPPNSARPFKKWLRAIQPEALLRP
eukprot:364373-Chlamydomonas_euryale.AAC.6